MPVYWLCTQYVNGPNQIGWTSTAGLEYHLVPVYNWTLTRWIKRVVLFNTAPRGVHLNLFIDKMPHSLWNMQFYIFRCLLPNLYQKRIRHIFEVSLREKDVGTF